MIADLNTYLSKAIPDTRLTIEKYADAKFEYLVRYHRMMSKDFVNEISLFFSEKPNSLIV